MKYYALCFAACLFILLFNLLGIFSPESWFPLAIVIPFLFLMKSDLMMATALAFLSGLMIDLHHLYIGPGIIASVVTITAVSFFLRSRSNTYRPFFLLFSLGLLSAVLFYGLFFILSFITVSLEYYSFEETTLSIFLYSLYTTGVTILAYFVIRSIPQYGISR